MSNRRYILVLIAMLTLALFVALACGPEAVEGDPPGEPEDPPEEEPTDPAGDPDPGDIDHHLPGEITGSEEPDGPDRREGTIAIEGMEEPMNYIRHHLPSMGLVFYVPEDLEVRIAPNGEEDLLKIHSVFGGNFREDVYLSIRLGPDAEIIEEAVQEVSAEYAQAGYEIDETTEGAPEWAVAHLVFEAPGDTHYVGSASFGNAGARPLSIVRHMPVEFGDGASARFDAVLDSMQWYFPDH